MSPTVERLRDLFTYDPEEGVLRWRNALKRYKQYPAGSVAGHLDTDTGYWKVWVDRQHCLAHRLIWIYMMGEDASERIDHRDTVRHHNTWRNLRLASQTHNNANNNMRSDNTSGFKGVSTGKNGRWRASIAQHGRFYALGTYDTREEAAAVYDAKARELYGEFARTNFGEHL